MTILYRTLKFPISDSEQLAEDVNHYSRLLQRTDGYGGVRRILIESRNPGEVFEKIKERDRADQWRRPQLSDIESRGLDYEVIEDYIIMDCREDSTFLVPLEEVHRTNHLWKPLADFIRQITSLESLFYESYSQFPPCLLDTIHRYQPQCKLYLTNFHLLSLNPQGTADEHESAILSSPCLRGIGAEFVQVGDHDEHGRISFFSEAMNCLVAGVAPNLKILFMIRLPPARHGQDPRPPWAGFTKQLRHENGQPKSRGSLEYLWISDWDEELGAIESLKENTDFSVLKVLRFNFEIEKETLEYLSTECEFSSLTELELKLEYHNRPNPSTYNSAVSSFLTKIPALTILKLYAWNSELATGLIFEHLGSSLRQLTLLPAVSERLSLQDLQEIAHNCPYLEELKNTVSRSKGDAQERAKYEVLGSFPRLQHLALRFDPLDFHVAQEKRAENGYNMERRIVMPSDPSFNDFDQQSCNELAYQANGFHRIPRKGHIRDAFINGALDCDLAISIWDTISLEKSSPRRNHNPNVTALPLVSMEVTVRLEGQYPWRL